MYGAKYAFVALLFVMMGCFMAFYSHDTNDEKQPVTSGFGGLDTAGMLIVGGVALTFLKYLVGALLITSKRSREMCLDFLFKWFPDTRRSVLVMARRIQEKYPKDFEGFFSF